jgi:hypothetical protein
MEERAHNNNKLCNPKNKHLFCLLQEIASISSTKAVMGGGEQMGRPVLMQSQSHNHFNNMISSSLAHNRR